MEGVPRISATEAHARVKAGKALLVCAYEGEARFAQFHLEGAIPFQKFKENFPTLAMDQEVIFYCNCGGERSASAQAANYLTQGYPYMEALTGGVNAWIAAGLPMVSPPPAQE